MVPNELWDVVALESDIFRVGEVVVQVEILDVNAGSSASWSGDDAVGEAFDSDQVGCSGRLVSWEVDEVASYCAADSVGVGFLFSVVGADSNVGGLLSERSFFLVGLEVPPTRMRGLIHTTVEACLYDWCQNKLGMRSARR